MILARQRDEVIDDGGIFVFVFQPPEPLCVDRLWLFGSVGVSAETRGCWSVCEGRRCNPPPPDPVSSFQMWGVGPRGTSPGKFIKLHLHRGCKSRRYFTRTKTVGSSTSRRSVRPRAHSPRLAQNDTERPPLLNTKELALSCMTRDRNLNETQLHI